MKLIQFLSNKKCEKVSKENICKKKAMERERRNKGWEGESNPVSGEITNG